MPRNPYRIVAIDCDAALGQRLLTAFWAPEYDFHWFGDGREALGQLQQIRPNVIVCELMLPGLDGRAVLETIRLWPELRDVPFFVLSSVRSEAIISETLDAGANAYLVKPCPVSQIKQAIDDALRALPQRPDLEFDDADVRARDADRREPAPARRLSPAQEPGTGTDAEPPTSVPLPLQAVSLENQPIQPTRRKAGKRKRPALRPAAAPERMRVPADIDLTPTASWASPAPGVVSLDTVNWEPQASPPSKGPDAPSRSYIPRVAAALLTLGALADTPPYEARRAGPVEPPPIGVTEPTPVPERIEAPSIMPAHTAMPTVPEPSPQAPAEAAAARPQLAPERAARLVRGRLQWAQALYDSGRYDDAKAALGEVFKLAPSNAEARQLAAQIEDSVAGVLPVSSSSGVPEQEHRAVLALLGRYQTALERLDLASLTAIWPSVDAKELSGRWKDVRSRQLALRLVNLQLTGDAAVAMCVSYDNLLKTDGERVESNSRVTFQLRRDNGSWLIDAVN